MTTEIGSYEAKTRLPELLRQVRAGKRFTITNRGKAIAELVPVGSATARDPAAAVKGIKALMLENPVRGVDIKSLIEEGRA